jgi:hypothetical protein
MPGAFCESDHRHDPITAFVASRPKKNGAGAKMFDET